MNSEYLFLFWRQAIFATRYTKQRHRHYTNTWKLEFSTNDLGMSFSLIIIKIATLQKK